MYRLDTAVMALLIVIALLLYALNPDDRDINESPTTTVKPFDDALQVPEPVIIAKDNPKNDAEPHEYDAKLTQEEPELVAEPEPTVITVEATFYTAYCEGCIGITKLGYDVRQTIYINGYRVIAVDPALIPLGSIVRVELEDGQSFDAIAGDTGGAIKGARIDVLVATKAEAYQLGRQQATVTILK